MVNRRGKERRGVVKWQHAHPCVMHACMHGGGRLELPLKLGLIRAHNANCLIASLLATKRDRYSSTPCRQEISVLSMRNLAVNRTFGRPNPDGLLRYGSACWCSSRRQLRSFQTVGGEDSHTFFFLALPSASCGLALGHLGEFLELE